MVLFGNKELLGVPKTAFLAASTIPPDMVLKCYDWAVSMANEGQCVISGFSSHLEREVLHFLMKGRCPIILVLARQMYKHTQWGQEHCVKWKPLTYAYADGFFFLWASLQGHCHSGHLLAQILQGLTELATLLVSKGGNLPVDFIAIHLLHEPAT